MQPLGREVQVGGHHAEKAEGGDGANPLVASVLVHAVKRGVLLVQLQREAEAVLVVFLPLRKGKRGNVFGDVENVFQRNALRAVVANHFIVHHERSLESRQRSKGTLSTTQ